VTDFVDDLPPLPSVAGKAVSAALVRFADDLRANPGRWACYPNPLTKRSAATIAQNIKRGKAPAFRDGTFEAAIREGVLYVRAVES
jgi:hypothetical protein